MVELYVVRSSKSNTLRCKQQSGILEGGDEMSVVHTMVKLDRRSVVPFYPSILYNPQPGAIILSNMSKR